MWAKWMYSSGIWTSGLKRKSSLSWWMVDNASLQQTWALSLNGDPGLHSFVKLKEQTFLSRTLTQGIWHFAVSRSMDKTITTQQTQLTQMTLMTQLTQQTQMTQQTHQTQDPHQMRIVTTWHMSWRCTRTSIPLFKESMMPFLSNLKMEILNYAATRT